MAEQYPGDPNAQDIVYKPNLNILQGWDGDARAFDADPLFVNIDDPIGPDSKWFTSDDGLRVITGSPTIDAGYDEALPADSSDLDKDGNITELTPIDIIGLNRRLGSSVDIGAYESDPVFLSGQAAVIANLSAFSLVTKSHHDQVLLEANATAKQAIIDAKVVAKAEEQNMGVDLVKASPNAYGLFSAADLNASVASAQAEGVTEGKALGQTIGEDAVTSNPSAYSLVTQDAYDQMMNDLMVGADANATPFVEDWFYHPKRSWMWTTHDVYPYFFDEQSNSWMYFKSGNKKPRFYHFGDEAWITIE